MQRKEISLQISDVWRRTRPFSQCKQIRFRSPRVGGPLSQSLAMIPPTMHGHEFNQPLSRVVMVRKTDQRTFSKGRRGGEPLLETVTRETVELFNGGRAERKYTSETRDIVTPKSNRYHFLLIAPLKGKRKRNQTFWNVNEVVCLNVYASASKSKRNISFLQFHFKYPRNAAVHVNWLTVTGFRNRDEHIIHFWVRI